MCSAYFTGPSSQIPDTASATARVRGVRAPARPRRRYRGGAAPAGGAAGRDGGVLRWAGLDGRHGSPPPRPTAVAVSLRASACSGWPATAAQGRGPDGPPDRRAAVRGRPRRRRAVYGAGSARRSSWSSSATPPRPAWAPTAPGRRSARPSQRGLRAQRPAGAADQRLGHRGGVVRARRPGRQRPGRGARARRGADHGRRERRDPPDRQVGGRAAPGPDGARSARGRRRGRRRHLPDLGTVEPVAQPLRLLARRWSRTWPRRRRSPSSRRAARTVSLGDLLGPEFYERPHEMFSSDRFHPSPAGYAAGRGGAAAQHLRRARPVERRGRDRTGPPPRRGRRPRRRTPRCRPCATPAPRSAPRRSGASRAVPVAAGPPCGTGRASRSPTAASWPASPTGASGRSRGPGRCRTGSHRRAAPAVTHRPGPRTASTPGAGPRDEAHTTENAAPAIASTVAARPKRLLSR